MIGVPLGISLNELQRAVYDGTDPKIMPILEEFSVPEGTGRLVLMHVYPGRPPYTNTRGRGTIRIGKDCQPLTGTLRRRFLEGSGEYDYTAWSVDTSPAKVISPVAMEALRDAARQERAPKELLQLGDEDMLQAIGVMQDGRLTRAAVLLAGSPAQIERHIPNYVWTHVRMISSTDYSDRADGRDAIAVALRRISDRVMADNPIETVRQDLFHFEYRTYPEIALREALLNMLCHRDFRIGSPCLVKQYPNRLEIANPGGLINGITPNNILHHEPATRNPCLVEALTRLRLINRTNLGIERIYSALLIEGKSPPLIEDVGRSVRLTFQASRISPLFRAFVAEEAKNGVYLSADHLLILRHMIKHAEINIPVAARLCQRTEVKILDILAEMENAFGHIEAVGTGSKGLWTLRADVIARIVPVSTTQDNWDVLKARTLRSIRRAAILGDKPLSNADVREITGLNRHRVRKLIHELQNEGQVAIHGRGRAAHYRYAGREMGS